MVYNIWADNMYSYDDGAVKGDRRRSVLFHNNLTLFLTSTHTDRSQCVDTKCYLSVEWNWRKHVDTHSGNMFSHSPCFFFLVFVVWTGSLKACIFLCVTEPENSIFMRFQLKHYLINEPEREHKLPISTSFLYWSTQRLYVYCLAHFHTTSWKVKHQCLQICLLCFLKYLIL